MERFSERQLIRWAIPGWITLFLWVWLVSTHLSLQLWLDVEFRKQTVEWFSRIDLIGAVAAVGATAVGIGFALGFVLFQVYYVLYWHRPCVIGGAVDDREALNLSKQFAARLASEFGEEFGTAMSTPVEAKNTKNRKRDESLLQAAWWLAVSNSRESRMVWEDKNVYLVAVYHALGAVLVGTYLTALLYIPVFVATAMTNQLARVSPPFWIAIFLNVSTLVLLTVVLLLGRRNTGESHLDLTKHALHHFCVEDSGKSGNKSRIG